MRYSMVVIFAIVLILAAVACSSSPPDTTTPPVASLTFGQLADSGKSVFATKCAGCHGNAGQGVTAPAVIGSGANLGKYKTAQGLSDFIDVSMPFNAPGSLSSQQYTDVLTFLLVQNNYVTPGTAFNADQLKSIQLTK